MTMNEHLSELDVPSQNHSNWIFLEDICEDLKETKKWVYDPCCFDTSLPIPETHNAEYGAYAFTILGISCRFRVAKITPTKTGQFVTLWERIGTQPIQPYRFEDSVEFIIISTRDGNNFGQFVFPKAVLGERDILSIHGKGGKRAFRVYPPWAMTSSRQARNTQLWQLKYFLDMSVISSIDYERAQMLYPSMGIR
jgi:hypothetical protein